MTPSWNLKLITPPEVEPVSLDEAKAHLYVTIDDDDALIQRLIRAARESAELYTRRAFVTQTWEVAYESLLVPMLELPKPPLQAVEAIEYTDDEGNPQTIPPTDYVVDTFVEPAIVYRARAAGWPVLTAPGSRARIRFRAGYVGDGSPGTGAENVPALVKQAILLHVGAMYENRHDAAAMPMACENLLHQVRVYGWGEC